MYVHSMNSQYPPLVAATFPWKIETNQNHNLPVICIHVIKNHHHVCWSLLWHRPSSGTGWKCSPSSSTGQFSPRCGTVPKRGTQFRNWTQKCCDVDPSSGTDHPVLEVDHDFCSPMKPIVALVPFGHWCLNGMMVWHLHMGTDTFPLWDNDVVLPVLAVAYHGKKLIILLSLISLIHTVSSLISVIHTVFCWCPHGS